MMTLAVMSEQLLACYVRLVQKIRWEIEDFEEAMLLIGRLLDRLVHATFPSPAAGEISECVQVLATKYALERDGSAVWIDELSAVLEGNDPELADNSDVLLWLDGMVSVIYAEIEFDPATTTLASLLIRALLFEREFERHFSQSDHSAAVALLQICLERISSTLSDAHRERETTGTSQESELIRAEVEHLRQLSQRMLRESGLSERFRLENPAFRAVDLDRVNAFRDRHRSDE